MLGVSGDAGARTRSGRVPNACRRSDVCSLLREAPKLYRGYLSHRCVGGGRDSRRSRFRTAQRWG